VERASCRALGYITDQLKRKPRNSCQTQRILTTFITFSSDVTPIATVQGPIQDFWHVFSRCDDRRGGSTDIFGCLGKALDQFASDPSSPGAGICCCSMTMAARSPVIWMTFSLRWQQDLSHVIVVASVSSIEDINLAQLHQMPDSHERHPHPWSTTVITGA